MPAPQSSSTFTRALLAGVSLLPLLAAPAHAQGTPPRTSPNSAWRAPAADRSPVPRWPPLARGGECHRRLPSPFVDAKTFQDATPTPCATPSRGAGRPTCRSATARNSPLRARLRDIARLPLARPRTPPRRHPSLNLADALRRLLPDRFPRLAFDRGLKGGNALTFGATHARRRESTSSLRRPDGPRAQHPEIADGGAFNTYPENFQVSRISGPVDVSDQRYDHELGQLPVSRDPAHAELQRQSRIPARARNRDAAFYAASTSPTRSCPVP